LSLSNIAHSSEVWCARLASLEKLVMRIAEISEQGCVELLKRVSIGRLGCSLDSQSYVVPVAFSYEPHCIHVFSTVGKKIEWMRQNPKVCLQADEITNRSNWLSVVVTGTYSELPEARYPAQREHALEQLSQFTGWWQTPLAQRREKTSDISIETVFFRIDIESMSGLSAGPEIA
jgi:nitroimidazol reductase NimA-like FMN-containing flavoprotein (pyridoxamine 5'-phosphate oxidase superfamily)